jgi:multidrug efflux system membrane fusion protein
MDKKRLGRILGMVIILGALVAILAVLREVGINPQTDDAEVFANLIGIAPEVEGRIIEIHVRDNQFVRKGELLFEIDPIPYQYALETAESQQTALEGQIKDLERAIGSQNSGILSAKAARNSSQAKIASSDAAAEAAQAGIDEAKDELSRAQTDFNYAEDNVQRLEPLLVRQFVTVDQVDLARTARSIKAEAVRQARAHLAFAQAQWASAVAGQNVAQAGYEQSSAELEQSIKSVAILDPLIAQRQARAAAVNDAAYNLARCKVYAPFDARVTNLTISEGAYAHVGQQAFTLIDARTWWVIANFRETELKQIQPGMKADVYVMSRPDQKFEGTVESTGFGVTPDASLVGNISQGLPDVQRSLNWVHLATRFPVRVRIDAPSPEYFRVGASAMVIVGGAKTKKP